MSIIRVEHLRKEYPAYTPIKDISFEVEKGEIITIIGPSGTGKSTLLRCINMLETPTSGKVFINDTEITAKGCPLHEVRKNVGMVFQQFNLFDHMNLYENIMYAPMKVNGMPKDEAHALADQLLDLVSLSGRGEAYPDELSGGQKQRAAIARTLAMNPEIILFDEPTSALDPTMVGQVLSVIKKLAARGLTAMIVTHEMEFARSISTRMMYLDQGEVYEDGTPEQIFEHPKRNRTRDFVERMSVLHKRIVPGNFDYLDFMNEIESYGRNHSLDQKKIVYANLILEELVVGKMLPAMQGDNPHLHFMFECSERDNKASVTILWSDKTLGNPFDGLDELGKKILENAAGKIDFTTGEKNNSLRFIGL